jgi:hypothetical protein
MPRQRIRAHDSPVALVGRVVLILFALAALWYGLMLVLLAVGVKPDTVDLISGYRTVYEALSGLGPAAFAGTARLVVAMAGLAAFLLFGFLAVKELPRPYVSRRRLELGGDERGSVAVEPRAVERVAEGTALQSGSVTAAAGRYEGDELVVNVRVGRPRGLPDALRDVRRRVTRALGDHDLPPVPVAVVLAGLDQEQQRQRELN